MMKEKLVKAPSMQDWYNVEEPKCRHKWGDFCPMILDGEPQKISYCRKCGTFRIKKYISYTKTRETYFMKGHRPNEHTDEYGKTYYY